MAEPQFEWDEDKARQNFAKHGVRFTTAAMAFSDGFALEDDDPVLPGVEPRFILTGMAKGTVLKIMYVERRDRIRIVSARKATRHEQSEYHQGQTPR